MKKKSLGISELKNSGWRETIKLFLLIISQRIPVKYKAPKVIVQSTPEVLVLHDLIKQWKTERQNLSNFIESIEERNITKKIFKHPIAGMLNIAQGISFFEEHIIHHKPQTKRLIKKVSE